MIFKNIICLIFFFICFQYSFSESDNQEMALEIPVYGDMESDNNGNSSLNKPFGMVIETFRNPENKPFDKKKAFSFYRSFYKKRGWKETIRDNQRNENYLEFSFRIYDENRDSCSIHLSATSKIWLAPKDGMVVIYMDVWTISRMDQSTTDNYNKIEKKLKLIAKKLKFSLSKAASFSNWLEYYKNPNLIDVKIFLLDNINDNSCLRMEGRLDVSILIYNNVLTALKQSNIYKKQHSLFKKNEAVIQDDNILIYIETRDNKLQKTIKKIEKYLN